MTVASTDEQEINREPTKEELGAAEAELRVVPVYSYILLACIAAVMIAEMYAGLENSIFAASFDKPRFIHNQEYWRILTGAAMHGSLAHILMNSYALYVFGRLIETLSNRAHLAIVFLLSAIGGGLLSLLFVPEGISVGASGGIVGFIGYLLVYSFRRRRFINPEFRKSLLINIGFILIFGLILFQIVDNWGHIGGLLTGAAYGFFQITGDPYKDPRIARPITEIAGVIALGIFIAASIFTILILLRIA